MHHRSISIRGAVVCSLISHEATNPDWDWVCIIYNIYIRMRCSQSQSQSQQSPADKGIIIYNNRVDEDTLYYN